MRLSENESQYVAIVADDLVFHEGIAENVEGYLLILWGNQGDACSGGD